MKLRYERGALGDLDEIFAYIAADNREAAGRVVGRIDRVAKRIAASPQIGGMTRKPGFLRFPVGKYLIVYEVGNVEVIVHYVRQFLKNREIARNTNLKRKLVPYIVCAERRFRVLDVQTVPSNFEPAIQVHRDEGV